MADYAGRHLRRRAGWCCSFAGVPQSPDHHHLHRSLPSAASATAASGGGAGLLVGGATTRKQQQQLPPIPKSPSSFHSSPSSKLAGLIDYPRRILSPGRVSPIDPDADPPLPTLPPPQQPAPFLAVREEEREEEGLDLRLCLRARDGGCVVVMELDSAVLCQSSAFFAAMAPASAAAGGGGGAGGKRIEVDGVENVAAFRDAVELMFEADPLRWLARAGVSRAIGVLEVASSIMFDRGIRSCLEYIEVVPWNENEEEKLKNVLARCTFDEALSKDVLARLRPRDKSRSEDLTIQLIQSVTSSTNNGARKDMQSLINGLLSKSSVYQKDLSGLSKGSLYQICCSCLNLLVELFKEDSEPKYHPHGVLKVTNSKTKIERVSKQSENLNWLFEILVNNDMAENFVELWANQDELVRMHEQASPMFRYELSRISANVFIALGGGKVQCPSDLRSQLFRGWFTPMLTDFGWLQRCSKGLDTRVLEESLGQALLTLPLQEQQSLFEEWFQCFASSGTECPNLSKAFQVWWRRSFVRSWVEPCGSS